MVNLEQSSDYVEDIRDDILGNWDDDLYTFINNDIVRAFWTAYLLEDMIKQENLDTEQYLLYSKQLRHCKDGLNIYEPQIEYWEKKYLETSEHPKNIKVLEYILSNMIYIDESDKLNMALNFGKAFSKYANKK